MRLIQSLKSFLFQPSLKKGFFFLIKLLAITPNDTEDAELSYKCIAVLINKKKVNDVDVLWLPLKGFFVIYSCYIGQRSFIYNTHFIYNAYDIIRHFFSTHSKAYPGKTEL